MNRKTEEKSVSLRSYRSGDLEEIERLFFDTVHFVNAADYSEEQLWAWAGGTIDRDAWDRSLLEHRTVIAECGGRIAGFGDMAADGYLDRLYVRYDMQGRGIGTAICDFLESKGGRFFTCASITARPFFEKRGYRVRKEQQVERCQVKLKNYLMEKGAEEEEGDREEG